MNLEKLAREIALCKSPNVDKWLVPIPDLEGMISMIQRQESELAKSHDEIEALKAARQPLADSFVAPGVTVDSPEFRKVLPPSSILGNTFGNVVSFVDQHTARAVAAAHQAGRLEAHNLHKSVTFKAMAQRDDALSAAQPVAGELPQLPDPHPTHYRERGLTLERLAMYTDDQMREYGRLCRASQPAQQPAAVGYASYENVAEWVERNDLGRAFGGSKTDARCAFEDAQTLHMTYTAPVPAAGVQGAKFDISTPDRIRLFDLDGMLLNYRCAATDAKRDEFKAAIVAAFHALATVPDSGRDAALVEHGLYSELLRIQTAMEHMGDQLNNMDVVEEDDEKLVTPGFDALNRLLAAHPAHPAPSSDAALVEVGTLLITQDESRIPAFRWPGPSIAAGQHKLYIKSAAHPANCPQAGGATANAEPVWAALTEAGQVKKGDKLRFNIGDKAYSETARQILFAGTDKEEVVYNKYQNFYFITSMAINGSSSHKNVEILAAAKKGGAA